MQDDPRNSSASEVSDLSQDCVGDAPEGLLPALYCPTGQLLALDGVCPALEEHTTSAHTAADARLLLDTASPTWGFVRGVQPVPVEPPRPQTPLVPSAAPGSPPRVRTPPLAPLADGRRAEDLAPVVDDLAPVVEERSEDSGYSSEESFVAWEPPAAAAQAVARDEPFLRLTFLPPPLPEAAAPAAVLISEPPSKQFAVIDALESIVSGPLVPLLLDLPSPDCSPRPVTGAPPPTGAEPPEKVRSSPPMRRGPRRRGGGVPETVF